MMYDEESPGKIVSFMEQLGTLCRHLDREVAQLKEEINQPPGQKPHKYDPAMKKLKKDVEELKTSSAEAKSKLSSMDNFSSFLETTTELVDEQEKSITKMEKYLQKFGYKPLEIVSDGKDDNKENNPSEKKLEVVSSQRPSTGHCKSPVLSEVGRSVIRGEDITQNLANLVINQTNHSSKENSMYERSKSEKELGLENLSEENQTNDLDENQYSGRPLPFPIKSGSSIINEHREAAHDIPDNRKIRDSSSVPKIKIEDPRTPATPEFSEATMSLLNLIKKENTDHNETYIPDEPSMHYVEPKNPLVDTPEEPKLLGIKKTDISYTTPESPVLSEATMSLFKCIPPAPHILADRGMKNNIETRVFTHGTKVNTNLVSQNEYLDHQKSVTPEEPPLNFNYSGVRSFSSRNTPEEPVLSSTCASSNIDDDMPPSPELSSYTQSYLKSHTHVRQETQQNDMRRSLYDTSKYDSVIGREISKENINRSHQTNEFPSRYKNQVKDQTYGALNQSEYVEQENDEYTSYVNNSSYMNKSGVGGANFSFITPAKERGNVNRSYSLAMERLAMQNDSPDSPQLSNLSMSIVNRSQRW